MGAWGTGNFDNDTACDWAYELEESTDLSVVERSLNEVQSEDYVDADVGCEAIAAAEVVARLRGKFGTRDSYTETVDKWVESHKIDPPAELVAKATVALQKIVSEGSELLELWEESGNASEWLAEINALQDRLKS